MTRQPLHDELLKRLKEKRRFLQVLAGPRQAGKTTLARQVMQTAKLPAHYASAEERVNLQSLKAMLDMQNQITNELIDLSRLFLSLLFVSTVCSLLFIIYVAKRVKPLP